MPADPDTRRVTARCVACGATRDIGPGEVPPGPYGSLTPREAKAVAALIEDIERRAEARHVEREAEIARRMYRRGYHAGRASARRGAPAVTNPESAAQGELRDILDR